MIPQAMDLSPARVVLLWTRQEAMNARHKAELEALAQELGPVLDRVRVIAQEAYLAVSLAIDPEESTAMPRFTRVRIDGITHDGVLRIHGFEYTGGYDSELRTVSFPVRWLALPDPVWRQELEDHCRSLREEQEQAAQIELTRQVAEEEAQARAQYLALKARFEGGPREKAR